MGKGKILLLEDDANLNETITDFLEENGYVVSSAYDGYEAQDRLYESKYDLLLLDVNTPGIDGFTLLQEARDNDVVAPAVFITSLDGVDDLEKGFKSGCDDYIRKPFSLKELKVRIESLLKRQFGTHAEKIAIDENFAFDAPNLTLYKNDEAIKLKNKEVQLLKLFLANPNRTLHKGEIFEALWDYGEEPNEGSLRTYIKVLRSHLGKESIETIKNVGYLYVKK